MKHNSTKLIQSVMFTVQNFLEKCSNISEYDKRFNEIHKDIDAKLQQLQQQEEADMEFVHNMYTHQRSLIYKERQDKIDALPNKPHQDARAIIYLIKTILQHKIVLMPSEVDFVYLLKEKGLKQELYQVFCGIATPEECDNLQDFFINNCSEYEFSAKLWVVGALKGYKGRETEFDLQEGTNYSDADLICKNEFINQNRDKICWSELIDWQEAWRTSIEDPEDQDYYMDERTANGIARIDLIAYFVKTIKS